MITKTDEHQYYFDVQLNWQHGRKGIITANDVKDTIHVATPPVFAGGVPDMWSPEHLFLSSLSSCFMTTFLAIAEKRRLEIVQFECEAIGRVAKTGDHLEFTTIDLYPKIFVENEAAMTVANDVMMKAYKHCIIANSIKAHVIHHGQVLLSHPHMANNNT